MSEVSLAKTSSSVPVPLAFLRMTLNRPLLRSDVNRTFVPSWLQTGHRLTPGPKVRREVTLRLRSRTQTSKLFACLPNTPKANRELSGDKVKSRYCPAGPICSNESPFRLTDKIKRSAP